VALLSPEEQRFADPEDIGSQIREYIKLRNAIDALDKRSKELRDGLMDHITDKGEEESNGSIRLSLPAAVDGVVALERQRRAKRELDEIKAEEIANDLGIRNDIYKMVEVLDEDALMAAHYEGKITEEQLDEMFPTKVTWALVTKKK
jgi:hypothetical protein